MWIWPRHVKSSTKHKSNASSFFFFFFVCMIRNKFDFNYSKIGSFEQLAEFSITNQWILAICNPNSLIHVYTESFPLNMMFIFIWRKKNKIKNHVKVGILDWAKIGKLRWFFFKWSVLFFKKIIPIIWLFRPCFFSVVHIVRIKQWSVDEIKYELYVHNNCHEKSRLNEFSGRVEHQSCR